MTTTTRERGWRAKARPAPAPTPRRPTALRRCRFSLAAVIIAHQLAAPQALLDVLAAAFIALRVAYIALYVADRAVARSVVWGLALLINMAIFFIGFR